MSGVLLVCQAANMLGRMEGMSVDHTSRLGCLVERVGAVRVAHHRCWGMSEGHTSQLGSRASGVRELSHADAVCYWSDTGYIPHNNCTPELGIICPTIRPQVLTLWPSEAISSMPGLLMYDNSGHKATTLVIFWHQKLGQKAPQHNIYSFSAKHKHDCRYNTQLETIYN